MLDRRAFMQLAVTGAWAISLGACGGSGTGDAPAEGGGEEQQGQGNATGMPNPFIDCDSAYDAAQLAGFEVTFPESVPDCSERRYQAVEGQMVQCIYQGDGQEVLIRKGLDDGTGDLSGEGAGRLPVCPRRGHGSRARDGRESGECDALAPRVRSVDVPLWLAGSTGAGVTWDTIQRSARQRCAWWRARSSLARSDCSCA